MTPEFSRMVRVRPDPPEEVSIEANEAECSALAARFDVTAIVSLCAEMAFSTNGDAIDAQGTLTAEIIQPCAVSGDDFTYRLVEPLSLRLVRQARSVDSDEEAELPTDEPDEIEFEGDSIDLGEAVGQSLGLCIDPYAEGPGADAARRNAGIAQEGETDGPLAELLKGLRSS